MASDRIVIFAHASGSSRHSRRNQFVARALQKRGPGTLAATAARPDGAADGG